jgi:phage tail sheath protein FI
VVTEFRHGIEIIEVDDDIRPIQVGPSNIIGVIGTAPDADETLFPLNEPLLIAGDPRQAALLGTSGTLPDAINAIFSEFGADIVMIRVTETNQLMTQFSNLIGLQTTLTGLFAFKKAKTTLGLIPKMLIAPGFTAQRPTDGVDHVLVNDGGVFYNPATTQVSFSGGTGQGVQGKVSVIAGSVSAIIMVHRGFGFGFTPPTVTITDTSALAAKATLTFAAQPSNGDTVTMDAKTYTFKTALTPAANEVLIGVDVAGSIANLVAAVTAGAGAGTVYGAGTTANATIAAAAGATGTLVATAKTAGQAGNALATTKTSANLSWDNPTLSGGQGGSGAVCTAVLGTVANPVVTNMLTVCQDMRSIMIVDTPGTSYVDAISYRQDFDSQRLWLVEGGVQEFDVISSSVVPAPVAGFLAGKQAYIDQTRGFWWSASNQPLNAVVGVNRSIDWSFTSSTVEGQLLNSLGIAVVVHEDGFRVLGVESPTSDSLWKFISVRRTADMVYDAIEEALRIAIDRPITLGTIDFIEGSVNAFLRYLANLGAIIDGRAWLDRTINSPTQLQAGHLVIDFDLEPPAPLERLTFRAHRNAGYYTEVIDSVLLNASTGTSATAAGHPAP